MSLFWWTSRIAVDEVRRKIVLSKRWEGMELDEDNVIMSSALFIGKAINRFRLETESISYNCVPHPTPTS